MTSVTDDRMMALFVLARQEEAAGISSSQIQAIEQLKRFSAGGDAAAADYLCRLKNMPRIHPFLREVLAS